MLALATALRRAGHEVLLAATPTFASEASALGVPFAPVGMDFQALVARYRSELDPRRPLKAIRLMNRIMPEGIRAEWESLRPLVHGSDLVVAAGATLTSRSAAEAARVPFRYVAYTPQILPSAWHPPMMLPITGTPRWLNRLGWRGIRVLYNGILLPSLNGLRHGEGLPPVTCAIRHVFDPDPGVSLLAADPEVAPAPPDLPVPQVGAFHLEDPRPLPAERRAIPLRGRASPLHRLRQHAGHGAGADLRAPGRGRPARRVPRPAVLGLGRPGRGESGPARPGGGAALPRGALPPAGGHRPPRRRGHHLRVHPRRGPPGRRSPHVGSVHERALRAHRRDWSLPVPREARAWSGWRAPSSASARTPRCARVPPGPASGCVRGIRWRRPWPCSSSPPEGLSPRGASPSLPA